MAMVRVPACDIFLCGYFAATGSQSLVAYYPSICETVTPSFVAAYASHAAALSPRLISCSGLLGTCDATTPSRLDLHYAVEYVAEDTQKSLLLLLG